LVIGVIKFLWQVPQVWRESSRCWRRVWSTLQCWSFLA